MNASEIKTFVAEKIHLHAAELLTHKEMADRIKVDSWLDRLGMGVVIQFDTYVVGMPTKRLQIHKQWPRDWWQAFRERWLPKWWLRKHPIQYEVLDIDQQLYGPVCPHLNVPDQKVHLMFLSQSAEDPP